MKAIISFIFLTLFTMSVFGQIVSVIGTVKDKDGKPIAAATVIEKGTTNSTLTDENGYYKIDVQPNYVLVFKMARYKNKEENAVPDNAINVVLLPDIRNSDVGVILGANICKEARDNYGIGKKIDNIQPFAGVNGGLFFDAYLSKTFAVESGLWFNYKILKEEKGDYAGTANMCIATMPIPFYCKFNYNMRKHKSYFFFGTVCNCCIKGKTRQQFQGQKSDKDITDYANIAPGFDAGIGYETPIGIGLRVNYDLWMIMDAEFGAHTFQASLTYSF